MSTKNLVATYEMIRQFKGEKTQIWLTLAEFIDNSISSYQGPDKDNPGSVDGLEINITYDYREKDNIKIIIEDNANGMDEDELVNSMQPSDRANKEDTHMNQYGVGMKLGIFWNGEDGVVYSKRKGCKEYYTELRTHGKTSEAVSVQSYLSNDNVIKYESGTTVIIERVYTKNKLTTRNNVDDIDLITRALGWRYNKLLSTNESDKKGMKIKLFVNYADKKTQSKEKFIQPFVIWPYSFNEFEKKYKNRSDFNFDFFLNEYNKIINNLIDENQDNELLIKFANKFLNNEELYDEEILVIENSETNTKKETILKFGVISPNALMKDSSYSKISGLTTYHINRAINHGPNSSVKDNNAIPFQTRNIGSVGDTTDRRLYGEINLTGIEVPNRNKSSFMWTPEGENAITERLNQIFNSLSPLLRTLVSFEKDFKQAANATSKEEISAISNFSKTNLNDDFVKATTEICSETKQVQTCYVFEKHNIKFFIVENENIKNFIETKKNGNEITIWYDYNHVFWKPFIYEKNTDQLRGKTIYPLILLIALCNDSIEKQSYIKDMFVNISGSYSLVDTMNEIIRMIEKQK